MLHSILILLAGHAVGDFLFQTAYLAEGKKHNLYLLFIHCILYTLPFLLSGLFGDVSLCLLTAIHFAIDLAKVKGRIGYACDQILHLAVLAILFAMNCL